MYEVFVRLLQENNVSTYRVAKETGIAQSVFSAWKKGLSVPKTDKMQKIADYFGVTVNYLMTGKEEEVDYYYIDKDTRELVDFIHKHPEHKVLMDASRKVKIDDIDKALRIIGLFTDEN